MSEESSILDKIITSKQSSDISEFNPLDTVSSLFKLVSEKEEDILRRRYGLNGKKEETLEEIGSFYKVTRERIRQIENTAVNKIKNSKEFTELVSPVDGIFSNILHSHGGIMEREDFFSKLLGMIGDSEINRNAVSFLINRLQGEKFEKLTGDRLRECWKIKSQSMNLLKEANDIFFNILDKAGRPLGQEEIINKFKESELFKREGDFFSDEVIVSYLKTGEQISVNPYGDYGLVSWGSINPKRINDKIFLVLKKHGKPLHFTKIAEYINKANFDRKKAYPPTVHNELILNKDYVLVGRGIYALKEWGYKSGVVSQVIEEILKNENRPLGREELINKVLEKRIVKKNTILLALTNKNKFKKLRDNTYILAT